MKMLKCVSFMLAVGWLSISANVLAGVRLVNCDNGDSLQKAIESGAGSAAPLEIKLLGTCYETFQFTRDKVTISGDGDTTIVGTIRIYASDLVEFDDMTFTGPGAGVLVFNGRTRFIRVSISGNEDAGIYARQRASVAIVDSHINDNQGDFGVFLEDSFLLLNRSEVIGNSGMGILASMNSAVSMNGSTIHANQGDGVLLRIGSTIEAAGVHIWENQNVGISMRSGSSGEISNSAINANGQSGLQVAGNSSLDVYGGMVNWNADHGVWVWEHSFLRLGDVQVSYNLGLGAVVARDGGLVLEGNAWIDDNVDPNFQVACQGKEASIEIVPPAHTGPMDCAVPDF